MDLEGLDDFFDQAVLEFFKNDQLICSNTTTATSEFRTVGEEEIRKLVENNSNKNTIKSTASWLRRFKKWAQQRGLPADIADIAKENLDKVLQQFFAELVKEDGENYEPESLKVMFAALDRHVREKCEYSILKVKDFIISRKVLNGKAIQLQEDGKGKRPNRADPFTAEEKELWMKVLGQQNPTSLNLPFFFLISQHFGTRGRQEHRQIRIEELRKINDSNGKLVSIEWMEGPTKTRHGGLNKKPRMVMQKLLRIGGLKCPIAALELLLSKRPFELRDNGPLYLFPIKKEKNWAIESVWFTRAQVGVHSIDNFVQKISIAAGLDITPKKLHQP